MVLEKYDLKGSVAVVTGGAGGIGLASAAALAECGAEVVIADCGEDAGEGAVKDLREAGHRARFAKMDVTDSEGVERCARALAVSHGRVDILVNCAGISKGSPAAEIADDDWRRIIDVNLTGLFWCCRAFGKIMLDRERGSIVNVGSMSGLVANRPDLETAYCASKAGVHMLTKSLAGEWAGRGIRVNAIAPTFHRDADDARGHERCRVPGGVARRHPDAPCGPAPRDRLGGAVPCLRGGQSDDRCGAYRRCRLHRVVAPGRRVRLTPRPAGPIMRRP